MTRRLQIPSLSKAKRKINQARHLIARLFAKASCADLEDERIKPYIPQSECLLFKLPPELRNQIWELVFSTPLRINLVDAQAPSGKNLTMTCQRMYEETAEMYSDKYCSYWTDTNFFVDVFKGDREAEVSKPGEVIVRTLDEERKKQIYTKVEELPRDDVFHIKHVYMYMEDSDHSYILGQPYADMWSYCFPTPGHPHHRAIDLYVLVEKRAQLESEGLETSEVCSTKAYVRSIVHCWEWEKVQRGRKIIDRKGLSKEQLMSGIRLVCWDLSHAP